MLHWGQSESINEKLGEIMLHSGSFGKSKVYRASPVSKAQIIYNRKSPWVTRHVLSNIFVEKDCYYFVSFLRLKRENTCMC